MCLTKNPRQNKLRIKNQDPQPVIHLKDQTMKFDLHGETRDEAIKIVQKFVIDCYQKNFRSALIITGKGHHSAKNAPVLKKEVKLWLERNGDSYISDFQEAPPRFGGSGAIWLNFK